MTQRVEPEIIISKIKIDDTTLERHRQYSLRGDFPAIVKLAKATAAQEGIELDLGRWAVRDALRSRHGHPILVACIASYYDEKARLQRNALPGHAKEEQAGN